MMTEFFTSLPFVGLFLKFMVASTVLMGTIWLLERLRILRLPDIRELAWKLAIAASFIALLPIGNWLSGPITIHHNEAKDLVSRFDSGQPISAFIHKDASPDQTVSQWLPAREITLKGDFTVDGVKEGTPVTVDLQGMQDADSQSVHIMLPKQLKDLQKAMEATIAIKETQAATPTSQTHGTHQKPEADSEDTTLSSWEQWVAGLSARALAATLWSIVALLALIALGFGYRSAIRDLGTRTRVDAEHPANRTLRLLCEKADIKHVPYLSRSSDIASPVCLPRREICLPDWAFDALPEREMQSLLAHELGHMIRRDPMMLMVLQLLSRLFFFQPFFNVARRRLADLAELAADEWAAKQLSDPRAVATALFTCATKIHDSKNLQWGLAMAGNKSMLKIRVERLVGANGAHFGTASRAAKGLLLAGVIGLTFGLPSFEFADAMSITAAKDDQHNDHYGLTDEQKAKIEELRQKAEEHRASAREIKNAVKEIERAAREQERSVRKEELMARKQERIARAAERAELARLHAKDHDHSSYFVTDDDSGNLVLTDKDRTLKASWEGAFSLNDTMDGVADVAPGAWLDIRAKSKKEDRRVHFENDGGKLSQTYWVNGTKQAMDKDGQKWLKATVSELTERTGWHASERIAMILKKGGVKDVLKLIKGAKTDYLKRIYAQNLLEQAKLKDHDTEKLADLLADIKSNYEKRVALTLLLEEGRPTKKVMAKVLKAAKTMDSDYELRQLLTPYLVQFPLDDDGINMLIDMAAHMKSDYELRNLLVVGLHDKDLSKKAVERVVKIATDNIKSDYEIRQLIAVLASQLHKAPASTKTLLDAVGKQHSDYEKRKTLDIVISQGAMTNDNWEAAIDVASKIGSDYEKAQSLLHIRAMMPDDKKLQETLAKAVQGIGSDYERSRLTRTMRMMGDDIPAEPAVPSAPPAQPAPAAKPVVANSAA
ncbi:M56 family metallopeptidase [Kordiimonas marina]|uniref:M56 family metallopeptidase n=1 Tax=Kordiimonas marina TaxID=2872312 RepID=UPI001FF1C898|nr:M56 family metallopeptidase [Kordiimonas marina]MCJ9429498.1 M48 family metalloprotease [Kordiimonas marina]